jgi:hypothetical protein
MDDKGEVRTNTGLYVLGGVAVIVTLVWIIGAWWM